MNSSVISTLPSAPVTDARRKRLASVSSEPFATLKSRMPMRWAPLPRIAMRGSRISILARKSFAASFSALRLPQLRDLRPSPRASCFSACSLRSRCGRGDDLAAASCRSPAAGSPRRGSRASCRASSPSRPRMPPSKPIDTSEIARTRSASSSCLHVLRRGRPCGSSRGWRGRRLRSLPSSFWSRPPLQAASKKASDAEDCAVHGWLPFPAPDEAAPSTRCWRALPSGPASRLPAGGRDARHRSRSRRRSGPTAISSGTK